MKRKLYHYTCSHGAKALGKRGFLRPGMAVNGLPGLVWLTDMAKPDRAALGLTSETLPCDRTKFRYTVLVDAEQVEWWPLSPLRFGLPNLGRLLELHRGRQPTRWYISRDPLWAFRPF